MAEDSEVESPIDRRELYMTVRQAVIDGLWSVLGSLAMAGFAVLLFLIGLSITATGLAATGASGLAAIGFGGTVSILAILVFLREFGLWPFARGTQLPDER